MNTTIKEVITRTDLKLFVCFPKKLYKDCPFFIPPLEKTEINTILFHPAKEFCDIKLWLAYQDKKIVGRIAGIINHKSNSKNNQKRVRFSWFDVIDDFEVAKALFEAVENWGKTQNLTEICGPSRFSNMEKQAMLIEGFDKLLPIAADYNFDYYPTLIENLGFEKEVDYIQYKINNQNIPEDVERVCEIVSERYGIKLRKFKNRNEMKKAGKEFFTVMNKSYQNLYNFIPLTEKEIDWVIQKNLVFAHLDFVYVLKNEKDEMVGISLCMPSLSKAFQKANGKLFPFGWFHILKALRKNTALDFYLTGVLPQYFNTGIHALYHKEIHEVMLKKGITTAYTTQALEDNVVLRVWKRYNPEIFCKRRCYKKEISN